MLLIDKGSDTERFRSLKNLIDQKLKSKINRLTQVTR